MKALIELISGVEQPSLPQMAECHAARLPRCVQEIRFRIERSHSEPGKPTIFYARIRVASADESYVAELVSNYSFAGLRAKLRKFLEALHDFEARAGQSANRGELAA